MAFSKWIIGGLVASLASGAAAEAPQFADVFGDHMVIQRDQPVRLFGTADPGDRVTVTLGDASASVVAGRDGRWWAEFPALEAGGPVPLTLAQDGAAVQALEDVLVGDVFLCSGQSNMAWPVGASIGGPGEIARATNDQIRLLQVGQVGELLPSARLPEGDAWQVNSPETVGGFSGVCYFTGRALQEDYGVPVGLINSSWGGSRIEPWISEAAFDADPELNSAADMLRAYRDDPPAALAAYADVWTGWWKDHDWYDGRDPWTGDASLDWQPTPDGRLSDWQTWGVPELEGFLGMVWHRTSFTLTEEQAAMDAAITIGQADDLDVTWVNGTAIGATHGWGFSRTYEVPAGVLKPGENMLVVNVHNTYSAGGLTGPDEVLKVTFEDGSAVPIAEGWSWLKVPGDAGAPMAAPWYPIQGFTMLHNGMIAPLAGLKLKGAIWYQGESNAGEGEAYEHLLGLLMKDWRGVFETADLPVAIIQLPRWGALPTEAGTEGWGTIREAMRRAAAADEDAGLVVAIDLGDPKDLHPPEKQFVAERAVRVLKALAYGEEIAGPSGPEAAGALRTGDLIRVEFTGLHEGLETVSASSVIGFEVCGTGGACTYATGTVNGEAVMVDVPEGAAADELRYCQGDSPLCNLYDGNGLPAGPFRLAIVSNDQ